MKKLLQRIRGIKKRVSSISKISGFTLLELLVAAAISSIIVSSLLAFLVSILQTDQREQAKVQTQEEVQAALDFIADDLKEAIYIYDADGVERNSATLPAIGGIRDQLPNISSSTTRPGIPILVFWKRHFYDPEFEINLDTGTSCSGESSPNSRTCRRIKDLSRGDGTGGAVFVRSLVAYYLRTNRGARTNAQPLTMQIDRFELRDGIRSDCGSIDSNGNVDSSKCNPGAAPPKAVDTDGDNKNDSVYFVPPDLNYRPVNLGGIGTVRDKYNRWRNRGIGYRFSGPSPRNRELQIVLNFVDDTFYTSAQDDGVPNNSSIFVPIRPNTAFSVLGGVGTNNFFSDNGDCADPSIGVGRPGSLNANGVPSGDIDGDGKLDIATQRIPSAFVENRVPNNPANASSFFVCVNSVQNVARVWIRGNALARQFTSPSLRAIQPTDYSKASFLTTASVRAAGRSNIVPPSQ